MPPRLVYGESLQSGTVILQFSLDLPQTILTIATVAIKSGKVVSMLSFSCFLTQSHNLQPTVCAANGMRWGKGGAEIEEVANQ